MTAAELQICQRVGAIHGTFVELTESGWKIAMELERVGIEEMVEQSGKVKLFKSLDTVFEYLKGIGIKTAFINANKMEGPEKENVDPGDLTVNTSRLAQAFEKVFEENNQEN